MKENYNKGLLILALLFLSAWLQAQQDYNKVFEKSFSGIRSVDVSHRRGDIEVLPSSNGQVTYRVELSFKAETESEAQVMINHFDINTSQSGSGLTISSDLNIKRWNSRNGNVRIEFSDGEKIQDIKDVSIKMQLFVPALDVLELENKYDDILIEQPINAELRLKLYSGRFKVGQVGKDLKLELKYSKGQIGNFKNGDIDIYDSDIKIGNGGQVRLKSKYSDIEAGRLQSLQVDSYDDELRTGPVQGMVTLEAKYSECTIQGSGNARFDLYDSELEMDRGKNLQVKSKYSTFRLGTLESLDFELSYDDEVKVKEVDNLSAGSSKYTDYDILKLNKSIKLSSYDDDLDVESTGPGFSGFTFDGKYTNVDLTLDPSVRYRVDAYTKYGKLNLPRDRFEARIHKEKNSELELKGGLKGAGNDSPLIKVNAHDCNISIN